MQKGRGIIFIALALVLGLGAAWVAQQWVGDRSGPTGEAAVATVPVVVARVDVSTATKLADHQLEVTHWPAAHAPQAAIASVDGAAGRVTRRPLATGEPVLSTSLFDEGTVGGLAAVIAPRKRAVSVKVDNVIGVAGFVSPGSRVDVLATLRRIDQRRALPFSKVILQDVPVLAIDQQLEEASNGKPETVNVVTLEVDPVQAEQLIYAAHEGRLQLALRTPGDDGQVETASIGVADLLSARGNGRGAAKVATRRGPTVQILRGSQMETATF